MLVNPDGVQSMKKEQHAEIALTAVDPHLDSFAKVTNVSGNPTRFFSGKVAVTKDLRATAPLTGSNRPKSPAGYSAQNQAMRSVQQAKNLEKVGIQKVAGQDPTTVSNNSRNRNGAETPKSNLSG